GLESEAAERAGLREPRPEGHRLSFGSKTLVGIRGAGWLCGVGFVQLARQKAQTEKVKGLPR
ncbi:MAG TPA: hypothetical protein PLO92_07725, partial [Anaerolineaceae bacterium]|nr:hypothetical protein [Anaerolineaceae bacterium]